MEEGLRRGMERPLPPSNRGHALLLKMGWGGGALNGRAHARVEVPPLLEASRAGVGAAEADRAAAEAALKEKLRSQLAFRSASSEGYEARKDSRDAARARRACRQLDEAAGVRFNALWARAAPDDYLPGAAAATPDAAAGLAEVLAYLRGVHGYCLYCGSRSAGGACPGVTRSEHQQ